MLQLWVEEHIFGILLAIEVLWVAGFLGVIVAYFLVKRHFAKQRPRAASEDDDDRS